MKFKTLPFRSLFDGRLRYGSLRSSSVVVLLRGDSSISSLLWSNDTDVITKKMSLTTIDLMKLIICFYYQTIRY